MPPKNREEYERMKEWENLPITKKFKDIHEIERKGRGVGYFFLGLEMVFFGGWVLTNYIEVVVGNQHNDEHAWMLGIVAAIVFIAHTILVYYAGVGSTNMYRDKQREFEITKHIEEQERNSEEKNAL